jgi:NAD(P)-dependent dehydrogenase (short-subunit alcohol dehydrogenase family)
MHLGITKDIAHVRGQCSLRESLTASYDVNVAGTHVTTSIFLPLLLQSSEPRLIFIAGLGTFAACAKGDFPLPKPLALGWPKNMVFETVGYRCSKTALNMLMLDYHWKLNGDGVKVWCVGPGFLATDLGDARELVEVQGAGHPRIGGEMVRTVVEGERDGDVGKYVVKDGIREF